ncbi:hypothetical protein B0H10DRAFT_1856843, partial [Mycena sp. CBHHK59/15]
LVADVSTNRRHCAKFHKPEYHAWCKTNDFESKLEEDVKADNKNTRRTNSRRNSSSSKPLKPAQPAPYTDELLLDAAIKWLIATDQVSHIPLMHPKFKEMIDIAARATQGINLPNHDQTHEAIIKLFHDQMTKLKIRLHVRILRY